MKRREFILTAAGITATTTLRGDAFAQIANKRDITYEDARPLESTGQSISDVVKILKNGERGNVAPVLREEILENPNAVFIVRAGIRTEQDEKGNWKPCTDQMERFGNRAAELVFRKGAGKGGRTFIKPNIVGLPRSVNDNSGGNVHPYFIAGMVDSLRSLGNSNIAIGARGALRHPQVISSGFQNLLNAHNLPLVEAHVQYFKDYEKSELVWHENRNGMIARRFYTYKPVYEKGTTFINIAHTHAHSVGHTTLTLKNLQGVMPRGYGHICDAWPTMDIWRRDLMNDFNRDYRTAVEKSYVRHGDMGFKYWDEGGFYKLYRVQGGYDAFKQAYDDYSKKKGEEREKALDRIYDIADSWLFIAEQWAQRMFDCIEVLPAPYVNMAEGVFGRGDGTGVVHSDFLTVGRSMTSVDTVTSWLMGHDPRELPYLRIAKERGLGENDIEKIPIYLLDEKGPKKVSDYRSLERHPMGIYVYRIRENGPRFF